MSEFSAFISYSHSDNAAAEWLHRALEGFRFPKGLIGSPSRFGPLSKRIPPVFRDRDELSASGDLGASLRAALANSHYQIVLCSPRAATSKWVNEEILTFKRLHGESRTLALILSGEPYSEGHLECFPPALKHRLDERGELSSTPAEPIAADIRPSKDGRRLALLKLLAGISGVRLDALVRRDAARRHARLRWIAAVSLSIAVVTIGLAIYAERQRRVAVIQQRLASRTLDFLISTFAIANPATEKASTITALSIVNRVNRRAAVEFAQEPAIGARLLRATGDIYLNLGLPKEAAASLQAALARTPEPGQERAQIWLKLASVAYKKGSLTETRDAIRAASLSFPHDANYAPELKAQLTELRGMAEILAGRYGESALLLGQAARQFGALEGDRREALSRVWMAQAQSLVRLGQFSQAQQLFRRAESIYLQLFGPDHVLTATAIHNQALADFEGGQIAAATSRMNRAVGIYDRVLENDHPTIGSALILLGRIRTAERQFDSALEAFDRARALFMRLYGARNPAVGDIDFYAAEAEAGRGKHAEALMRLARTKVIYDDNYGPEDPDQVELLYARSRILSSAGMHQEARQNCRAGLALRARLEPAVVPAKPDCTV